MDHLWLCHGPHLVGAISREEDQSENDSIEVVATMPARRRPQHKQGGQQSHLKGQQGQQATSGTFVAQW